MSLILSIELPKDVRFISAARASSTCMLENLAVDTEDIDIVNLVLGELCSNASRHTPPNVEAGVSIKMHYLPRHVQVTVRNTGVGFDRDEVPPPDCESVGGRGLCMVESLSEQVDYKNLHEGGMSVSARVKIHRRPFNVELS